MWTLPAINLMPSYCTPLLDALVLTETTAQDISFMTLDFAADPKTVNIVPDIATNVGIYNVKLQATLSCPNFNSDPMFVNT